MDRDVSLPYLMRAACELAAHGMHVFPLHPGTKRPALRSDWEGAASIDIDRIQRWWRTNPFNIGIATGPSRLLVVDLDAPKGGRGAHGRQSLAAAARVVGATIPRNTLTVVTPGSGQHLYFRTSAAEGARSTVGFIGTGVDTRGAGGYVVGPGSVIDGRRYRLVRRADPVPVPDWILDALRQAMPEPRSASMPTQSHVAAYVQAALTGEVENVSSAVAGTRNHTLFKAAARLGRFVADGRLSESDVRVALERASHGHVGVGDFTSAEVARTIRSGLARAAHLPSRASCDGMRPER